MDEALIEKVKLNEIIYNHKLATYRDKNEKRAVWEQIGKELEVTGSFAKARWDTLRRCYSNARNRRRDGECKQAWKYEKKMSFLLPYIHDRIVTVVPANLSQMAKSKSEIQNAVRENDPKVRLVNDEKAKSAVWNSFVHIEYDNTPVDFVACLYCKHVLSYTPKHGTGALHRHKCVLRVDREPPNFDPFAIKSIPKQILDGLAHKQLSYVTKDLLPFNVTEGKGFREYAQALINIGAEYGAQRIDDLVVSQKTLTSSAMVKKYNKMKTQLTKGCANAAAFVDMSFKTDEFTVEGYSEDTMDETANFEIEKEERVFGAESVDVFIQKKEASADETEHFNGSDSDEQNKNDSNWEQNNFVQRKERSEHLRFQRAKQKQNYTKKRKFNYDDSFLNISTENSFMENFDHTDLFFLSMSKMTKQLPKADQSKIKFELSNLVLTAEMKYHETQT